MNTAAIHIINRNIRTKGTEFVFKQYPVNDIGDVMYDEETNEITLKGIFHEEAGTRDPNISDFGYAYSRNVSMILTDFNSAKDIQRYSECMIGGEKFKVISVVDIEQQGKIAEIVIERMQGDV